MAGNGTQYFRTNVMGIKKNADGTFTTTDGTEHARRAVARAHQRSIVRESKLQMLINEYFPKNKNKMVSMSRIVNLMATDMTFKRRFMKLSWY